MLQIQPLFTEKEKYVEYCRNEDFTFEVLELSMPHSPKADEWYLNCGLVSSLHGAFVDNNPASGDEDFRELSRFKCEESCKIAMDCGAGNVIFHGSCFPFLRGPYLKNWADGCAEFYEEMAELYKLNIFIENSFDIDCTPMLELFSRIKSDRIKVCLDIGHANYSRVSPEGWIEQLGDRIGYLHLSDNIGDYDSHLPLGNGNINWKKMSDLCSFLPGSVPVTLEVGNLDGINKSVAYLKENNLFTKFF